MPISDGILSHPRPLPRNADSRIHRDSNAFPFPNPTHGHQHGHTDADRNPTAANADTRGLR